MSSPTFSILIPTRDRPDTFRHTLATVAGQPGDDYEIVVADNCSGPQTREIVEALGSPRLRYVRSDEILPMAENWERGLALCEGEYVTVLGDDDALVPSTLEAARKLIEGLAPELISWSPHVYWWRDAIVPWERNLLIVTLANGAVQLGSREVLRNFYADNGSGIGALPMIYNAFFHRSIIEEAERRYDGLFMPREAAPDIASGILGLHITETHIRSTRPLSIRGNSRKSNGTAQWARSLGAEQREIYFREERVSLEKLIHRSLVPSPNLGIIIANAKLRCRDSCFPDDPELQVDLRALLASMVADLNFEPEAYEDNLRDVQAFAAKLGVGLDAKAIPPMVPRERKLRWGPDVAADKTVTLGINGELAGLRNIAQAAGLVEAVMAPVEEYPRV